MVRAAPDGGPGLHWRPAAGPGLVAAPGSPRVPLRPCERAAHPCYLATDDAIKVAMENIASGACIVPWGTAMWTRMKEASIAHKRCVMPLSDTVMCLGRPEWRAVDAVCLHRGAMRSAPLPRTERPIPRPFLCMQWEALAPSSVSGINTSDGKGQAACLYWVHHRERRPMLYPAPRPTPHSQALPATLQMD